MLRNIACRSPCKLHLVCVVRRSDFGHCRTANRELVVINRKTMQRHPGLSWLIVVVVIGSLVFSAIDLERRIQLQRVHAAIRRIDATVRSATAVGGKQSCIRIILSASEAREFRNGSLTSYAEIVALSHSTRLNEIRRGIFIWSIDQNGREEFFCRVKDGVVTYSTHAVSQNVAE